VALQSIQNTIVCAPDGLRDALRSMTCMQLIRTLAAWRPDLTAYRDVEAAYRITFKSLARRYLELHDEIADLDIMIGAIVDKLAPDLVSCNFIGISKRRSCCSRPVTILIVSNPRPASPRSAEAVRFPPHPEKPSGIASTEAAISRPTAPCTSSRSDVYAPIPRTKYTLSTVSVCSIEEVAGGARGELWSQRYVLKDRGYTRNALERSWAAGMKTLVFTADMPVPGSRYRDRHSGMSGPAATLRQYLQAMTHPRWALDVGLLGRSLSFGNIETYKGRKMRRLACARECCG
jgi:hypothetical protein